jgi:hypothetical protein
MNTATAVSPTAVPSPTIQTMTFGVAELGAMKSSVDSLAYCRNKTEQNKISKLVVSYLSQISRVRGGKALNNIKLVGYSTNYSLEEDDLMYTFSFVEVVIVSSTKPVA